MITPLERVQNLLTDLRMSQADFDMLFAGKNDLTPPGSRGTVSSGAAEDAD